MTLATPHPHGAPTLGDADDYGPGPLSPVWPRYVPPPPPANEWAALADELGAIRRSALAELRQEGTLPYFLTQDERARIEAAVARLKTANAVLLAARPMRALAELPTPVLPPALLGVRDIAAILGIAIDCALRLSQHVESMRNLAALAQHGGQP